ncbi:ATP-dependent DNA helicase RecG [Anaerolentibacter hominis]|uniref:ATP-dependent DNA helicase RecG n=1 Tax=Anaerolentibacter hominis TaxID=3079009 RepID=UPI0031B8181F
MEYTEPVGRIKGIGEKTAVLLARLGIGTVGDLLEYYPRDYDQYGEIIPVEEVSEGTVQVVEVSITAMPEMRRARKLTILSCIGRDETGTIRLTWFNMPFMKQYLHPGTRLLLRGKIGWKNGMTAMEQPKLLSKTEYYNRKEVMQPVYGLTFGLTNTVLGKAMRQALDGVNLNGDYLSAQIRKEYDLLDYKTAIREIHFPKNRESMMKARKRLVFDEFFLFTLYLRQLKGKQERQRSAYLFERFGETDRLQDSLPYELTGAQKKVWEEIRGDLAGGFQMNRLIQGDVGSGKTVLAVLALLSCASNGCQGCLMVPTEVLAKQHFSECESLLSPFGVRCCLLVGSMTQKEKREAYEKIREHQADVIIGTHALIQDPVEYDRLALVITDEQHRFGVKQRERLSGKGEAPHVLVMSATPIPRTLAIIIYGDLDLSVLDELPANRLPVKNCVVDTRYRPTAYEFIKKQVEAGHQAYIICPMVEDSETVEAENVIAYCEKLRSIYRDTVRVSYLHGKMKASEKNQIMEAFSAGEIQVLVSTTVVEVGVNVPNATVMMIENGERFGLAQLHQLRGRVGRGNAQSYCIIVSGSGNKETKKRLETLNHSNDGFYIAEEDLRMRGPGDLFGIRQSGVLEFRLGDIFNDAPVLKLANELAGKVDPEQFAKVRENDPRLSNRTGSYLNRISL